MSTVPTTEAEPAQEPFVRFAAFRGKIPLPWVTVFALAIVMAAADGFILTSLQGAVGAIERSQGPFASWARDTAIVLPVFVVAVMWAFTRAHRKHGLTSPAMRSWRRIVTTALLIVAAGTTVGVAETTVSAAMDYRLQSQLLQRMAVTHGHATGPSGAAGVDPAYSDGSWTPEQRQTMALDVKAVGYGAGLILGANIVLVGWVVALRGGRLDVVPSRRRRASGRTAPAAAASPATA
ncbi:MAG TPA: hypothetical protein VE198_07060 [Actinoallomurus sp.]|nr:hypothetical protein [Actinoallomurus sp.]